MAVDDPFCVVVKRACLVTGEPLNASGNVVDSLNGARSKHCVV